MAEDEYGFDPDLIGPGDGPDENGFDPGLLEMDDPTLAGPDEVPTPDEIQALMAGDVAAAGDGLYAPPDPNLITQPSQSPGNPSGLILSPSQAEALGNGMGTPALAPQLTTTTKRGGSNSVSSSSSGMTPGGLKLSSDLFTREHQKADIAGAGDDAEFAAQRKRLDENFEAQKNAALEYGRFDAEHQMRIRELEKRQIDLNETHANLERRIHEDGKIVREKIMSGYREQLSAVKALAATTGNPLGGLGIGQGAALGAAMFVQGFLAVQGVNINVGAQIDKWVDRSIQEHQMKIDNAQQGAKDQLHLYDIARQSSEDDWEARQRFHGFALEAFKGQMAMEAARFGSDIAASRAMAKAAEFDMIREEKVAAIGDRAFQRYTSRHAAAAKDAHDQGTLAIQREANSIAWSRQAFDKSEAKLKREDEAKKDKAAKPTGTLFSDPGATKRDASGKVIGTANRWGRDPNATEHQFDKASDTAATHVGAYAQVVKGIEKLRALKPPAQDDFVEKYGMGWATRFSEAKRTYERQVLHTVQGIRHTIAGAALNKEEKGEWDSLLQTDSGWQDGSNMANLSQMEARFRDSFVARMDNIPGLQAIPEDQETLRPTAGGRSNDTDAALNAETAAKRAKVGPVAQATAGVTQTGHNEVESLGEKESPNGERLAGGGYSQSFYNYITKTGDLRGAGRTSNTSQIPGQKKEIDVIDRLAAMYVRPSDAESATVGGVRTDDPAETKQAVLAALKSIAAGKEINGRVPDPEVQAYTTSVIEELQDPWSQSNPDALFDHYTTKIRVDDDNDPVNKSEAASRRATATRNADRR
jgi:hypothetical protein